MSYARWGKESDVYVYPRDDQDGNGEFVCCACRLDPEYIADPKRHPKSYTTSKPGPMIEHMCEHLHAGHKVPASCITELREEAKEMLVPVPPHTVPDGEEPCRCTATRKGDKLITRAVLDQHTASVCRHLDGCECEKKTK